MRISPAGFTRVGLDLGTSTLRAAAWSPDGVFMASKVRAAPPMRGWRGLQVQDPREILLGAAEVLAALGADMVAPRVALTTQRDTLLLVSSRPPAAPAPLTPLLSWRERRYLEDPELRRSLLSGTGEPLSLEDWILACWTGGIPVPGLADAPLEFAGGDKNCEYLALGVRIGAPGVGVVSLGSAISLGMAAAGKQRPDPLPGVVMSPMAGGHPGWNAETGVLSGMGGRELAAELAGVGPWRGELPSESRFRLVPHFGGALDDPDARPRFEWADGTPLNPVSERAAGRGSGVLTPASVAGAWAEGVARELARLRPRLEHVAGAPLSELRLAGGGASDPAWISLLERAFGIPVTEVSDAFAGCRGAVIAAGWAETSPPPPG